jgi:AcrR family transcriptional regulator
LWIEEAITAIQDETFRLVNLGKIGRVGPNPSRRSERSRQAILHAAIELLHEVGYAGLTIEAIAAEAKVGKQTIYRWWPSKGFVVLDAFLEHGPTTTVPDTGDLRADLKALLRTTTEDLSNPLYRALITEAQHDEKLAAELTDRLIRPLLAATRERLGTSDGVAADLLLGPIYYRWLLRIDDISDEYIDRVVDAAIESPAR